MKSVQKSKKWKYHTSHTCTDVKSGQKITFVTQLYKVGVYGILNNDPAMQMNLTPNQMVLLEKKLNKDLKKGEIKDLKFGHEITVSDETGFYEEIE
jgi:hypothetical protein